MIDNQILNGMVDMSSTEPHVTVECPLCHTAWMKKVEIGESLTSPCICRIAYCMRDKENSVEIEMFLTPEQAKIYFAP